MCCRGVGSKPQCYVTQGGNLSDRYDALQGGYKTSKFALCIFEQPLMKKTKHNIIPTVRVIFYKVNLFTKTPECEV